MSTPLAFDLLPIEFILTIWEVAAEHLVISDRTTACSLVRCSKSTHHLVRPILFRTVVLFDQNLDSFTEALLAGNAGTLVRDLTILTSIWFPRPEVIPTFTQLQSLSGYTVVIEEFLGCLPHSHKVTLRKIHVRGANVITNLPPSVTHVCITTTDVVSGSSPVACFASWVSAQPSIRWFGYEVVAGIPEVWSRRERHLEPAELASGFISVLKQGPTALQLNLRMAGPMSSDALWDQFITALQPQSRNGKDRRNLENQIHVWRDQRSVRSTMREFELVKMDAYRGQDVWSEAIPLELM